MFQPRFCLFFAMSLVMPMNLLPSAKAHPFFQKVQVESSYPNRIAQGPIIYAPMPSVCQYRNRLNTPENCPRKRRSTLDRSPNPSTSGSSSPSSRSSDPDSPKNYSEACKKAIKNRFSKEDIMAIYNIDPATFKSRMQLINKSIPGCENY